VKIFDAGKTRMIGLPYGGTSSSAVAKRPRDALCLSVVSFNSTKRRVESFCWLHRLQIYHSMQLNALFCCLWRNVEASFHKHFIIISSYQHRRLLPSISVNLRDSGPEASY